MSLTSVLKDSNIKAQFKQHFPVPKTKFNVTIQAPPITKKYSLIGTAFDYLLRFHLKQTFPKSVTKQWVAETAVDSMKLSSGEYVQIGSVMKPRDRTMEPQEQYPDAGHPMTWHPDHSQKWADAASFSEKMLNHAKKHYEHFIKTGNVTDDLIKSTLNLASLDAVLRAGRIFEIPPTTKDDIADIENLLSVMKNSGLLHPKTRAFLNPTFGEGSHLVSGADADLIIDKTLIDIKTTKSISFTQDMYNQLLGYYALSTFKDKLGEITNLGIYFSRYGVLHTVPVPTGDAAKTIIDWFKKYRKLQSASKSALE